MGSAPTGAAPADAGGRLCLRRVASKGQWYKSAGSDSMALKDPAKGWARTGVRRVAGPFRPIWAINALTCHRNTNRIASRRMFCVSRRSVATTGTTRRSMVWAIGIAACSGGATSCSSTRWTLSGATCVTATGSISKRRRPGCRHRAFAALSPSSTICAWIRRRHLSGSECACAARSGRFAEWNAGL
jgi:hypothetical protein